MEVRTEPDIVSVRVRVKAMAEMLGFGYMDQTRIATAVSELARNVYHFAGGGKVIVKPMNRLGKNGIEIIVEDHGPGIENLELALKGGHSTRGGLGLGLSGSKKLMDEFDIKTKIGEGTTVTIRKWL